jgi:ABC-type iron transport system FetAB ATPase subunit
MQRYFFRLSDSIQDDVGVPYRTLNDAKKHAQGMARALARNALPGQISGKSICVTDESGKEVFRTALMSVV